MADISQINFPNDNNNPYDIKDATVPHSSLPEASGGTDLSLVTTGEKYTWNNGCTDTTYTLGTSDNNVTLTPSSGSAQSITVPYSTLSNTVNGVYTGSGGRQDPSYFGTNRAGFLMSNASVAGDTHYKNWLYMDNYNGSDVGGATAFGIDRTEPRAFIMQSDANRTTWNNTAALGVFTATPTSGQVVTTDDTTGGIKSSGYTIATSVPSNAEFTDANVTQTATTTASVYEMIFSGSANNTTETAGVRKTDSLVYNPNNYNFASRCMAADASKANNGVSANTWFPMMSVFDKSNRITTRIEDAFYTNGDIKASFLVRQYDTNGDQVANKGISMTMDKSGNLTYGISDASAFLTALGLTTTSVSYTVTKSSGVWSFNKCTAYQYGNVVNMELLFKGGSTSASARSVTFTGTSTIRPKVPVVTTCIIGTNTAASVVMLSIETNGNIELYNLNAVSPTASQSFNFSCTFLV